MPSYHIDALINPMESLNISPDAVCSKLDTCKSPGPEVWPPCALKETASVICKPLSIIFSASLDSGTLPVSWTIGHVTPIHKKGNRSSPSNY